MYIKIGIDITYGIIYKHMHRMARTLVEELATHHVYMNSIDTGELYIYVSADIRCSYIDR